MADEIPIVPFQFEHISGAVRLSQQAGWPHRADDWAFTGAVSQGFVALNGDEVVGTAFCSEVGEFCTINMIIVDESMRGHGLGRRLMNAVIDAAAGRGMTLVATTDGLPLYQKLGFAVTGEIVQHQGIVADFPKQDTEYRTATTDDLDALARMDCAAYGTNRKNLLANLLDVGTIIMTDDGFAGLRDFGRGQVIGPVVAKDAQTAKALIHALATPGKFLRADIPVQSGLADFLTEMGMANVGGGTVMHCGPARPAAKDFTTYALTSQALG